MAESPHGRGEPGLAAWRLRHVPSALVTSTKHPCPLTSATQQGDLGC